MAKTITDNDRRIARATTALVEHQRIAEDAGASNALHAIDKDNFVDLIADLVHAAHAHGLDPDQVTRIAYEHFIKELLEEK